MSSRAMRAGNLLPAADSELLCKWDDGSTYIKNPPYFQGMTLTPWPPLKDIEKARVLACAGVIPLRPITSHPPSKLPRFPRTIAAAVMGVT